MIANLSHWAVDLIPKDNRDYNVALAYEVAAIEGLNALCQAGGGDAKLQTQASFAARRIFDIRQLAAVPKQDTERIFYILQLAAFAFCGGRKPELERWFAEHGSVVNIHRNEEEDWDRKILSCLFACWLRLFRKESRDNLDRIRKDITTIRDEQSIYEKDFLESAADSIKRSTAIWLITLYHWVKATETLAEYLILLGSPTTLEALDRHFRFAIKAATLAGKAQCETTLRWLHAVGKMMVMEASNSH